MSTTILQTFARSLFNTIKTQSQQTRLQHRYKAALVREQLKGLSVEHRARQTLGDNDVRIQVQYCSINSLDLINIKETSLPYPLIPGYELAGEVIDVGKKVSKELILKGEKVAALSLERFGGLGQECVLSIKDVFRLPSNLLVKDAAVITDAHTIALWAFSKLSEMKENDFVLVTAGLIGLGLAGIDVAANVYKSKVIGVFDVEDTSELLRERGAFKTVQYGPKLENHVLAATAKQGASIVYDAVGRHMFDPVAKCTASGGHIFHVAQDTEATITTPPPNRNLAMLNLAQFRLTNFEQYRNLVIDTLELADQGVISAHIAAEFNLDDINKAMEYIEEKKPIGKILIKLDC